jgi:hypothetical protein
MFCMTVELAVFLLLTLDWIPLLKLVVFCVYSVFASLVRVISLDLHPFTFLIQKFRQLYMNAKLQTAKCVKRVCD